MSWVSRGAQVHWWQTIILTEHPPGSEQDYNKKSFSLHSFLWIHTGRQHADCVRVKQACWAGSAADLWASCSCGISTGGEYPGPPQWQRRLPPGSSRIISSTRITNQQVCTSTAVVRKWFLHLKKNKQTNTPSLSLIWDFYKTFWEVLLKCINTDPLDPHLHPLNICRNNKSHDILVL